MAPTPALIALFNSIVESNAPYYVARLYTITLFGGGQIRFTDADFDINANSTSTLVNGFTYASGGIRVDQKESKTQAHFKVGTDTDPAPHEPCCLGGETQLPDILQNSPKSGLRSTAHSSICIQEGQGFPTRG